MPRILVVDDDDGVREMVRQMLQRAGYEVSVAVNGKEGLKLFRSESPDLIVLDIVMPEKEGLETIRELRRDDPGVKVIAMSGGGRMGPQNYIDVALALGAQRAFAKPLDRKKFLAALDELAGPPAAGPPAAA